MRRLPVLFLSLIVVCVAAVAAAQTIGTPSLRPDETVEERDARRAALFEALRSAETEAEAQVAEQEIWNFWFEAPSAETGRQMARAVELRGVFAYQEAREILDEIVARDPDYAEGWNQRAFVLFLQQDYDASLTDIDRTLELEPDHFGALAGQVQIFIRQGRLILARSALRRAVKANPWIARRGPPPGLPDGLDGIGEDI